MEFLLLGTVNDAFGLDGTLKIYSQTQFGDKRYQKGNKVYLFNTTNNERIEANVISYRHSGLFDYVKLNIINTKEEAEKIRHYEIHAEKTDDILAKDEFYYADLKDCEVIDENNNLLGTVLKVEEFPAQVTLRVKGVNGKQFLVPFVKFFIKNVDIKEKKITINVIEGLL